MCRLLILKLQPASRGTFLWSSGLVPAQSQDSRADRPLGNDTLSGCHCICLWIPLPTGPHVPLLPVPSPPLASLALPGKGMPKRKGVPETLSRPRVPLPGIAKQLPPSPASCQAPGSKAPETKFPLCVLLGGPSFRQPGVGLGVGAMPLNPVLYFISLIYHEDFSQSRGERHSAPARFPGWAHDSSACSSPQHRPSPGAMVCSLGRGDMAEPVLSIHLHFLMWRCLRF